MMISEDDKTAMALMKDSVLALLRRLDADNTGTISFQELGVVFEDEDSLRCLEKLNICPW